MKDWIELIKEYFYDCGTWGRIFFILLLIVLLFSVFSFILFVIVSILTFQIVPLLIAAFFVFLIVAGFKALMEDL